MGFTANQQNAEPTVSLTPAQLQEMMVAAMIAAVKEMKKPTEDEQRQLDEEKALRERRRSEMITIAREEEEMKKRTQAACDHKKPNGQYAVGGQVFSDGIERHFCLRCQKVVYSGPPAVASMAGGLGGVTESFV